MSYDEFPLCQNIRHDHEAAPPPQPSHSCPSSPAIPFMPLLLPSHPIHAPPPQPSHSCPSSPAIPFMPPLLPSHPIHAPPPQPSHSCPSSPSIPFMPLLLPSHPIHAPPPQPSHSCPPLPLSEAHDKYYSHACIASWKASNSINTHKQTNEQTKKQRLLVTMIVPSLGHL